MGEAGVAGEVGASAAQSRDVPNAAIESIFRPLAAHARQSLEIAAERKRIPWDFQVIRGQVDETLTELMKEVEERQTDMAGCMDVCSICQYPLYPYLHHD